MHLPSIVEPWRFARRDYNIHLALLYAALAFRFYSFVAVLNLVRCGLRIFRGGVIVQKSIMFCNKCCKYYLDFFVVPVVVSSCKWSNISLLDKILKDDLFLRRCQKRGIYKMQVMVSLVYSIDSSHGMFRLFLL